MIKKKSPMECFSPLAVHEIQKSLTALENFFELYMQGNDFRNDAYTIDFLKTRISILRDYLNAPLFTLPLDFQNDSSKTHSNQNYNHSKNKDSLTVLVDDDVLVRMTWEMSARNNGKQLLTFSSPDEFLQEMENITIDIPIYIDANLGEGIRGEDFAKKLRELGFKDLYLATGYDPNHFAATKDLFNGIVGKEPPWVHH